VPAQPVRNGRSYGRGLVLRYLVAAWPDRLDFEDFRGLLAAVTADR
jgi:hypothetical protein